MKSATVLIVVVVASFILGFASRGFAGPPPSSDSQPGCPDMYTLTKDPPTEADTQLIGAMLTVQHCMMEANVTPDTDRDFMLMMIAQQ